MRMMKILVACEESQAVTREFRKLGHEAYSCDLLPCSGGHPEWHFNGDVIQVIEDGGGKLQNGERVSGRRKWEMMVAHPPCTYLAVSGAQWYYHPDDRDLPVHRRRPHPRYPTRVIDREEALSFFLALANAPIDKIAVENPIGIVSSHWRKPDQVVHPWMFGTRRARPLVCGLRICPPLSRRRSSERGSAFSSKAARVSLNGIQMHSSRQRPTRREGRCEARHSRVWQGPWLSNGVL